MSIAANRGKGESPPLWQVVDLVEYTRPEPPAAEAVRSGLPWPLGRTGSVDSANQTAKIYPLSAELLEKASPWPDWHEVVAALDRAFSGFNDPVADSQALRAVVGAPYSGMRETLRCWADQHQWPVVEPPSVEQILANDESWFAEIAAPEGPPILIVELEHFVLRHPLGLSFVRRLLDALYQSPRACLIAANSWAWTYLDAAIGVGEGLETPKTFQAFDASRLEQWFQRLHSFVAPTAFCQADNGSLVLAPRPGTTEDERSARETSKTGAYFFRQLAGYSGGIAGIAWAVWRRSLGVAANKRLEKRLREAHHEFGGQVICVRPWSQINPCSLPPDTDLPDLFLLHALLIHGGLAERVIPLVLPSLLGSWRVLLRKLAARGIVEHHQGRWQVTPLGYPATREALAREGLFIDPC